MPQNKYAKAEDFLQPKQIIFVACRYVPAAEVGARFADSKGNTNQLRFQTQSGEEMIVQSTSYGLTKAFSDAKLSPGDECLVQTVILQDPYSDRKFYHWCVNRLQNNNVSTVQYDAPAQPAPTFKAEEPMNQPDPWDEPASEEPSKSEFGF